MFIEAISKNKGMNLRQLLKRESLVNIKPAPNQELALY
jgi:LysM repeat protein